MDKMQLRIGQVLRYGLWLSVIVVLLGGLLYLSQNGHQLISYQHFQMEPKVPGSILNMLHVTPHFSAVGVIQLGLFLLVLTQILRVIMIAWLFFQEKDVIFTGISLFILGILSYSLFWR